MASRKVIIDTDPGADDILAILFALSALPEEIEVSLISVTYGNVDLHNCTRNVVSMFHHLGREIEWRKSRGLRPGFTTLTNGSPPIVALGPEGPLEDEISMADYFHGKDGLGDIHESHPHLSPADTWKTLFDAAENSADPAQGEIAEEMKKPDGLFRPSQNPSHEEILRLLRESEPDTYTIVAIGPLTNLALAAAEDAETFLRVREVVVMGGAVACAGNITPSAEFNTYADSFAAARVYALTSPHPESTLPPTPPAPPGQPEGTHPPPHLKPYPRPLSRPLNLTLFPLDITERHVLPPTTVHTLLAPHLDSESPLAHWVSAFMTSTFAKIASLRHNNNSNTDNPSQSPEAPGFQLHDPLCIWYCLTAPGDPRWRLSPAADLRVEPAGQWTRGMCVVDLRTRRRRSDDDWHEAPGDSGAWLAKAAGNRIRWCVASPGEEIFGQYMLERIFAP